MMLINRVAIITGASQGLGEEIAKHFVSNGASVFLCARNFEQLLKVQKNLLSMAKNGQSIHVKAGDVSDYDSVKNLIDEAIVKFGRIDILVNNAGVYGPLGNIEDVDAKEWVDAININLLGVFYGIKAVIPHFKKNNYGKIINLSGGGATNPLPRISSYAASKAAVVRLSETIALEVKDYHIDINCIAPGALNTDLNKKLLASGKDSVGAEFHNRMSKMLENGGTPLEVGAALAVYLASQESDGITGKLISAPWDPWKKFDQHREELQKSDIYTLRRIIPSDRGKDWDK